MTGEYGDNYGCEKLMGEWFREVLPAGSQIHPQRNPLDIASGMNMQQGRSSIGESHVLPRGFISPPSSIMVPPQTSGMVNSSSRKDSPQQFSTIAFGTPICLAQTYLPTPKLPDIPLLSLRASTEKLLAAINAQDQAPDDPSVQDRQCAPRDFFINITPFQTSALKVAYTVFNRILSNRAPY